MDKITLRVPVDCQKPDIGTTVKRIKRNIESIKKYSSAPTEALYLIALAALEELGRQEEIDLQTCGYLLLEEG